MASLIPLCILIRTYYQRAFPQMLAYSFNSIVLCQGAISGRWQQHWYMTRQPHGAPFQQYPKQSPHRAAQQQHNKAELCTGNMSIYTAAQQTFTLLTVCLVDSSKPVLSSLWTQTKACPIMWDFLMAAPLLQRGCGASRRTGTVGKAERQPCFTSCPFAQLRASEKSCRQANATCLGIGPRDKRRFPSCCRKMRRQWLERGNQQLGISCSVFPSTPDMFWKEHPHSPVRRSDSPSLHKCMQVREARRCPLEHTHCHETHWCLRYKRFGRSSVWCVT